MYFYVNILIYVFLLKVQKKENLNILSILCVCETKADCMRSKLFIFFFTYLEVCKDLVKLNLFSVITISSDILNSFLKT